MGNGYWQYPLLHIMVVSLSILMFVVSDTQPTAMFTGAVGINTTVPPKEALTVGGNILVTGDVLKPSDVRLKVTKVN